nr:DUF1415 family protein [Aliamphritea spongicola]
MSAPLGNMCGMNTTNLNTSPEEVRQLTEDWVRSMVVGLNLCPFAAPVLKDQSLRFCLWCKG